MSAWLINRTMHTHIKPILKDLDWLPVTYCPVHNKILLHTSLTSLADLYAHKVTIHLCQLRIITVTYGDRSFMEATPYH